MIEVIHSTCGKPAILMTVAPKLGDAIEAKNCFHLDMTPILAGSSCRCDSCGGLFNWDEVTLEDIKDD